MMTRNALFLLPLGLFLGACSGNIEFSTAPFEHPPEVVIGERKEPGFGTDAYYDKFMIEPTYELCIRIQNAGTNALLDSLSGMAHLTIKVRVKTEDHPLYKDSDSAGKPLTVEGDYDLTSYRAGSYLCDDSPNFELWDGLWHLFVQDMPSKEYGGGTITLDGARPIELVLSNGMTLYGGLNTVTKSSDGYAAYIDFDLAATPPHQIQRIAMRSKGDPFDGRLATVSPRPSQSARFYPHSAGKDRLPLGEPRLPVDETSADYAL